VYWYGEADNYSLVPQGKFLSISEARLKNCFNLPTSIQKKVRRKKRLSFLEQNRLRAQTEMEEDRSKKPEERPMGRIPGFEELCDSVREADLLQLVSFHNSGEHYVIGEKRKIVQSIERPSKRRRLFSCQPQESRPSGGRRAPDKSSPSMPTELLLHEEAPPITEYEFRCAENMLTVFCRVPLLREFYRPFSLLYPEVRFAEHSWYILILRRF